MVEKMLQGALMQNDSDCTSFSVKNAGDAHWLSPWCTKLCLRMGNTSFHICIFCCLPFGCCTLVTVQFHCTYSWLWPSESPWAVVCDVVSGLMLAHCWLLGWWCAADQHGVPPVPRAKSKHDLEWSTHNPPGIILPALLFSDWSCVEWCEWMWEWMYECWCKTPESGRKAVLMF